MVVVMCVVARGGCWLRPFSPILCHGWACPGKVFELEGHWSVGLNLPLSNSVATESIRNIVNEGGRPLWLLKHCNALNLQRDRNDGALFSDATRLFLSVDKTHGPETGKPRMLCKIWTSPPTA